MDLPVVLNPRVLANEAGRVHLALEDDRIARVLVLGLGTVAVGTLGTGWTVGGPVWPWVGVLSVPALAFTALALASIYGRRVVEVVVEGDAITIASARLSLLEVREVRLEGSALVLDHPLGPVSVELAGEDEDVRDALRRWLDHCRRAASPH